MKRITLAVLFALPLMWIATSIGDSTSVQRWIADTLSPGDAFVSQLGCTDHALFPCLGRDLMLILAINLCVYGTLVYLILMLLGVSRDFLDEKDRARVHNSPIRRLLN